MQSVLFNENNIVMLKCFLNFQNDYKFKMALKYLRLETEKKSGKKSDRMTEQIMKSKPYERVQRKVCAF